MFPLEVVLFPDDDLPLRIFEPRYSRMVADCLAAEDPVFGIVLIAAGREVGGGDARYDVGALARIVEHRALGAGKYTLRCRVSERIKVQKWLPDDPYPRALVQNWPDEPGFVADESIADVEDRVMELFERLAAAQDAQLPPRDMLFAGVALASSTGDKLYALASRVPMGQADRYAVLAAPSPDARLRALSEAVDTVAAMVDFQLG
ncbi:MAG: LON peptidase substrate-binding domain-containing protein [Mycobacteriaceae bacterium]|nr:LON peptidase substrate-binding domain-containing protein [Mycobacteriaceae bacterium]